MQSSKLFRPLFRGLRPLNTSSVAAPGLFARAISSKVARVAPAQAKPDAKMPPMPKNTTNLVLAGMPQLVPFYFVNEVAFAFALLPALIYLFSKYILPQKVRLMCARLFISKL